MRGRPVDSASFAVSKLRPVPEILFFRPPGVRRAGTPLDDEWRRTGREDELWGQVESWQETGYLPRSWHHPEPGTGFDALGPPRSTVRLYYARHAGQVVLLHARRGKSGAGKLPVRTKELVEERLGQWRAWFPHGADIDESDCLIQRAKK